MKRMKMLILRKKGHRNRFLVGGEGVKGGLGRKKSEKVVGEKEGYRPRVKKHKTKYSSKMQPPPVAPEVSKEMVEKVVLE